ncbi:four helix bundle protein [candidate division TA06 bacterium]|uniref:Four helix bundle protein n=1 Tax=candidate division TA06 bacterium TaxID=2250710 RepID=A0A933I8T0_UNCT6|nr:four helix bundle protein [candidate division TA06 bacterium]
MNKFRDLKVYQKGVKFSHYVYELTSGFPKSEIFGLTFQLRRASCSIVLNIAEGAGSDSSREFVRYLEHSQRSTFEMMAGMDVAKEIGYVKLTEYDACQQELTEISVMLKGLQRSLKKKTITSNVQH